MSDRRVGAVWVGIIARIGMVGGVLAWLWPIGLGGQMLVGGDTTRFSMGLMAFYRSSLLAGRLPLWNDLWGFGFPGLAESQMGVYYPPHWLLYGFLSAEVAGVVSLVLHTLWAALGAYWASRRFGTSEVGAALAGFAWATCGFFFIHLSHQWGFTVGSWMPWAWGLTWRIGRGEGSRRTPWLLAGVLAVQVLPGHFQLAFVTEVGCLALAAVAGGRSIGRRVAVAWAVAGMIPLAAMQLWPTLQLARLSDSKRDFEYLSGFAASPLHFVSFVAPGLFHRSELWRPVAWEPFHTSPEELLTYVGLVPLFLAIGAIIRGWRADPAVRALTVAAGFTLLLSLGPYAPGFEWLVKLPGFSFFRAPARWGLATSLALAVLAGKGFDRLGEWPRVGRSTRRFAIGCLAWVFVVILGFELAQQASKGGDWKPVASAFDRAWRLLPWAGMPEEPSFRDVMSKANRPPGLPARVAMARTRNGGRSTGEDSLANQRFAIYARELGESGALLAALVAAGTLGSRPRWFAAGLLLIAVADPLILAGHRPFDFGPARPLTEQSPVLARLAREPRGTRTLDPSRNLFMLTGVDAVWGYRTLDLPAPGRLLEIGLNALAGKKANDPIRVAGVGLRVFHPAESTGLDVAAFQFWWDDVETFQDPDLAGWMIGVDFAKAEGLDRFILARPKVKPSRAWLMPSAGLEQDEMGDAQRLIDRFQDAIPLPYRSRVPEETSVTGIIAGQTPSMVVLTTTFDPEWQAEWANSAGERRPAEVVKVLGGWQGVATPGPGPWTLHLSYPGRAAWAGLAVSAAAWLIWIVGYVRVGATKNENAGVAVEGEP